MKKKHSETKDKEHRTPSTESESEKSTSERTSRGTLVSLTGDETDEECERIAYEIVDALGLKH